MIGALTREMVDGTSTEVGTGVAPLTDTTCGISWSKGASWVFRIMLNSYRRVHGNVVVGGSFGTDRCFSMDKFFMDLRWRTTGVGRIGKMMGADRFQDICHFGRFLASCKGFYKSIGHPSVSL
jgi:hypothetical protein